MRRFYDTLSIKERNEIRAWLRGEQWLSGDLECAVHYWLVDTKGCPAQMMLESSKAQILALEEFGHEDEPFLRLVV
jgi:hypothetical protein